MFINQLYFRLSTLFLQVQQLGGLSDAEKKEKLALEKKLSEMEEELKVKQPFSLVFRQ